MSLAVDDTIAAIATAAGRGLRGIVRLSGPSTRDCLQKSLGRRMEEPAGSGPARCSQVLFYCPPPIGEIPCQLYLWPMNRSYTRQESAEIHMPGSTVLVDSVLEQLCRNGARLAQPGEFTLRAFLAGRIDLTQAEAVLGVIHASGEEQLDDALRQLAGGLATPLQQLRASLLDLLAELAELIPQHRNQSAYPSISRDLNIVLAETIRWSQLEQLVQAVAGNELEAVDYQETYRDSEKDGADTKRILFSMTLRSQDATMTGEHADDIRENVVAEIEKQLEGRLLS